MAWACASEAVKEKPLVPGSSSAMVPPYRVSSEVATADSWSSAVAAASDAMNWPTTGCSAVRNFGGVTWSGVGNVPTEFHGFAGWSLIAVQNRVPAGMEPLAQNDQPPASWNSASRQPVPNVSAETTSPCAFDVSTAPGTGGVTCVCPPSQPPLPDSVTFAGFARPSTRTHSTPSDWSTAVSPL